MGSKEKNRTIEEIMESIRYLVKLQGEEVHADNLMKKGELFMQSAQAYINIEKKTGTNGQGDKREVIIFDSVRRGLEYPIYCMYAVNKDLIFDKDGKEIITFDKRAVKDFCKDGNGFITVVDTMKFINQFKRTCSYGFEIGLVRYGRRSFEFDKEMFISNKLPHHYKDSRFSYQNEFRIVVGKKLDKIEFPYEGACNDWEMENLMFMKYAPYIIEIGDISDFSRGYNISQLEELDSENYILEL